MGQQNWFYTADGKNRIGPLPFPVLQQLAASGVVLPNHMVLEEGSKWTQAALIPGLFPAAPPPQMPVAMPVQPPPYLPEAMPVQAPPSSQKTFGQTLHENWAKFQAWFMSLSKGQKWGVIGGCVVMFLLCGGILGSLGGKGGSKQSNKENSKESATAMPVSAGSLLTEYKNNEIAADNKYKGKILEVTGTVNSVSKGVLGDSFVTLQGGGRFEITSVQCYFDDEAALASLSKGQTATVIGRCDGKFGNVALKDCKLK